MRYNVLLLFAWLLFGCSPQSSRNDIGSQWVGLSDVRTFTDESFPVRETLSAEILADDFTGDPVRMALSDSLLLLVDAVGDHLIRLFDIRSGVCTGSAGTRGRGPNELLSVGTIRLSEDQSGVWCYDITSRTWLECDSEALAREKKFRVRRKVEFARAGFVIDNPVRIDDRSFAFVAPDRYEERFFIADENLSDVQAVRNDRIEFRSGLPDAVLGDIHSVRMDIRPDRSRIVLAGRYLDIVEIYDRQGRPLHLLQGPLADLSVEFDRERSLSGGAFVKSPETRRAYLQAEATDEHIYLLYSGKRKRDESGYSFGSVLYVTDWEGNPVARYDLGAGLSDFAIDAGQRYIYGIQPLPQPRIVRFRI